MPNEMTNHDIETVRITENDLQVGHVLFRLLDLVFVCSGFCLQAIILVASLCHFLVQLHFTRAGQTCDTDR